MIYLHRFGVSSYVLVLVVFLATADDVIDVQAISGRKVRGCPLVVKNGNTSIFCDST